MVELLEKGINCLGKERGSCGGRIGDRQEVGSERTRLVRGGLSAVFMGARGLGRLFRFVAFFDRGAGEAVGGKPGVSGWCKCGG